jgi:hypothetical protein
LGWQPGASPGLVIGEVIMAKKRGKSAYGVKAVKHKNKKLAQSYAIPPAPPETIVVVVPQEIPVVRRKKQGWVEYLFGTTKS